jgi:hypothetical protein
MSMSDIADIKADVDAHLCLQTSTFFYLTNLKYNSKAYKHPSDSLTKLLIKLLIHCVSRGGFCMKPLQYRSRGLGMYPCLY